MADEVVSYPSLPRTEYGVHLRKRSTTGTQAVSQSWDGDDTANADIRPLT